jgi:hypothetical protein
MILRNRLKLTRVHDWREQEQEEEEEQQQQQKQQQ